MNTWAREEQQLWDTMMTAGRGIRMPPARSMSPKARAKVREKIIKQRASAFAAGWKALSRLIDHR
jgi:hypothetical protein